MSNLPAWLEALNISPSDYEEWLKLFPMPDYILSWAIESRRIDESAYLKWAQNLYQLPLVKADFFKQSMPIKLWEKELNTQNWGPTFLPLAEWEGMVMVGALEPPKETLDQKKYCLILAPSTEQKSWWVQFALLRQQNKNTQQSTVDVVTEMPTPTPAPTPPIASMETIDTPVPLEEAPQGLQIETPAVDLSMPEGLNISKPIETESSKQLQPEDSTPQGLIPEGLSSLELKTVDTNSPEGILGSNNINIEIPKAPSQKAPAMPPPPPPIHKAMPPPPPKQEVATTNDENTPTRQWTFDPMGTPKGPVIEAFDSLKTNFERYMVLMIVGQNLVPYQWQESWSPDQSVEAVIPLRVPSFLNIVANSRGPFHGNPRPNAINDQFCKRWYHGKYPQHITALPLMEGEDVFGVLFASTTPEKAKLISLAHCFSTSLKLSQKMIEGLKAVAEKQAS